MNYQASDARETEAGTEAPTHDIITIGASSGGVEALMRLVRRLPGDFPAAIFVVLHLSPRAPSHLPQILSKAGPLPARHPADGEPIIAGQIYVAPPDLHLTVEEGRVHLVRGPRENRHRPAVDVLFRSAAQAYGPRVVGVVLTGALDDGTAGLLAIKQRGGIAVVQDPKDALIPGMPESALEFVDVDYRLPLAEIAPLLAQLSAEPAPEEAAFPVSHELQYETSITKMDRATLASEDRPGTLVGIACPECGGPLYELHEGLLVRYRCRVGHAYSGESVMAGQLVALEDALWSAYNTLRESGMVSERLAADARRRGHPHAAKQLEERAALQKKRAETVYAVIGEGSSTVPAADADDDPSGKAAGTQAVE